MPRMSLGRAALAGLGTLAMVAAAVQPAGAAPRTERAEGPVAHAFSSAAAEYGVPRDLLIALGYSETHLDGHHGLPSQAGGYGMMHLVSNPDQHTLELASRLTGDTARELRTDTAANIRGGAAVLRFYADHAGLSTAERRDTDTWYPLLARYGGATDPATARLYANTVYTLLAQGVTARAEGGEKLTLPARKVAPERGAYGSAVAPAAQSPDYPSALWVPADPANYAVGRTAAISKVVIHVTEGSYAGSISWFQNPSAQVSAHYVVRSSDGQITQTVREKDTAWHARSGNATGIGIEHEGYIDNPSWFTDAMYRSSAALTASICARHGIPTDRAHIVGHSEVPGNDHTDPGPNWNWTYYMQLVGGSTGGGEVQLSFPSYDTLRSGSTGAQVSAAQSLLNAQGFDAGTVDGSFGPKTTSAVTAFQKARGLAADGVVGARTWTALLSAGTTPALSQGSTGAAVQRLQRALTATLGRTVTADGDFGSGTQQAVRDYQTSRSLGVDGQAGPATWGALQAGR
ncbi:N-acetylmuramoyl-L-alanine amidase [Streptomyces nodosus]|uniref:N-acetylmuramoyl-L-alanine amidase n=1 Tax=Streptomyces nodosus TaxID=40318 RepID=UPI0034522204